MKNSGFRAFICVILILSFVSSSAVYGLAEGVEPTETVQAVEVVEEATDLSIGSKGDQVVSLQQRLYQLGFFTSAIDGDFGNNTMAAVQEAKSYWRELEQKKIDQYIASLTPAPTQTPEPFTPYPADDESFVEEVQAVEILPTDTPAPTPTPTPLPTPDVNVDGVADLRFQDWLYAEVEEMYLSDVELGSHGLAAKRVQRKLILLNYLNDMADGVFGVNSETALKAFQDVNGLEPSGVADRLTQNALFSENPVVSKKPVYNQMVIGSSGEAVSAVQQQLIILGFMNGGITGTYNTSTSNGVKALEKYLYLLDNQSFITQMLTHADEAASSDLAVVDAASAAEIGDIEGDPELNPYEILPESESHSAADAAGFEATGIMTDALTRRLLEDGIQVYSDIVREGDRGDLVLRVQRRLASLEYLTASGIDGIYGGGTKKAISSFQARNHMEPTGIADQATQYILFTPDAVKAIKPYMIKVSIADQRVYVYSPDETDNYTILVKEFKCSTGTNSHPTPKGTFKNTGRGATWHYFKKFDCWAQYAWYVDGDIMIHSVIFSRKDERSVSQGSVNALGSKASHGCIRLSVENAKWIWEHCGSGTTVVVY